MSEAQKATVASDPVTAALGLASDILTFVNTENARKYLNQEKNLRLELLEEQGKPYEDQDDQKIVDLHKRIVIIANAARQEFELWKARQK